MRGARKHGLSAAAHQDVADHSYPPVIAALTELFEAGKSDGNIRLDADPGDFLQLTVALWRVTTGPLDRAPHMLALILDGLGVSS